MNRINPARILAVCLLYPCVSFAGPKLSRGTSAAGVVAYQDNADPNQFHYFPLRCDLVLGQTLLTFDVSYWGINSKPYYRQTSSGDYLDVVGANLSGTVALDITDAQRAAIKAAISADFGVPAPKLLPIQLLKPKGQFIIAQQIIDPKEGGQSSFPDTMTVPGSFPFSISTADSTFATLVAGVGGTPGPRPFISAYAVGDVEFEGDPWIVDIECDLSQVWSYVRKHVSASAGWGWFSMDASYDSIVQDLFRQNIIQTHFVEGSLDNEKFGRQIFEVSKQILEAINKASMSGEGFFRFEPNPNPQGGAHESRLFGWCPWSVSINASYSAQSFSQNFSYKQHIDYKGKVLRSMGTALPLAVTCGDATKQFYHDFQNSSEACLTQSKLDGLQRRITAEVDAKRKKSLEYLAKLESGEWTVEKYRTMMAILYKIQLTEGVTLNAKTMNTLPAIYETTESERLKVLTHLEDGTVQAAKDWIKKH